MRITKTVGLGPNREVTVNELRVRDARNLLAQAKQLENIKLEDLLGDKFSELAGLLGDCILLPQDETLDDLTGSELAAIFEGFREVNASFLALAGAMFPLARAAIQTPQETPSTGSMPPASS